MPANCASVRAPKTSDYSVFVYSPSPCGLAVTVSGRRHAVPDNVAATVNGRTITHFRQPRVGGRGRRAVRCSFGEGDDAPAITVTMRDVRCSMVNLDPDSASPAPEVLKAVVRANQNNAGIYGADTRIGPLAV